MNNITFCYEIHKDAGLAYDRETGENAKSYMQVNIDLKQKLTDAEYKRVHKTEMINQIAKQTKIQKKHLEPITLEQFLANTSDNHKMTI